MRQPDFVFLSAILYFLGLAICISFFGLPGKFFRLAFQVEYFEQAAPS